MTSHDCVARIRRLLRIKRVGHAGTLDPAATGVLPIAVGKATRLLQYLPQNKAYRATIRLGVTTTTDDLEGEILTCEPVAKERSPEISGQTLQTDAIAALSQFVGTINQVPPAYSAIQVKGQRLYDLARRGEEVEVPMRQVQVHHIDFLDWRDGDFPEIDVAIACGPGTYIRAIARDLGALLNTGGTLASLTRTESSGFTLDRSITFEELETQLNEETFKLISPVTPLSYLPEMILESAIARRWCQGQRIAEFGCNHLNPHLNPQQIQAWSMNQSPLRVHDETGEFLGISLIADTNPPILIPKMVFAPIS
jgi:tRNA pseudouridine55 synthase